jgi:2-iminobutanoate/2-iminopropanoate deaminase
MDFLLLLNKECVTFRKIIFMRAIFIVLVFSIFLHCQLDAQDNTINKEKFNWGRGSQDTTAGYAQAVKMDNVIYISGTVAREVNPEGIKRVYEALEKTLQHYGATFQNVLKENLYTTDIEAMKQYNYVRKTFYKGDFPAATWVQISRLYMADAKLEIELIAYLPKK